MIGSSHTAQTGSFMIGRQDLLLLCLTTLIVRIHDCRLMTILASELLVACAVFAVLDDIHAVASGTVKVDCFANHVPFIPSFRKTHYRKYKSTAPNCGICPLSRFLRLQVRLYFNVVLCWLLGSSARICEVQRLERGIYALLHSVHKFSGISKWAFPSGQAVTVGSC